MGISRHAAPKEPFAHNAPGQVRFLLRTAQPGATDDEQVDAVLVMPEVVLDSPRIVLRPFRSRDAGALVNAVDEHVRRWLSMPEPYDAAAARRWCNADSHQLRIAGDGQHWVVADRFNDRFLGTIGFNRTRWEHGVTEVGYWIGPDARCKGIASESVRLASEWALRRLDICRVELQAAVGNSASRRVAQKSGFVREGVLRRAGRHHTRRAVEQRDLECWSLIRDDLDGPATAPFGGVR